MKAASSRIIIQFLLVTEMPGGYEDSTKFFIECNALVLNQTLQQVFVSV